MWYVPRNSIQAINLSTVQTLNVREDTSTTAEAPYRVEGDFPGRPFGLLLERFSEVNQARKFVICLLWAIARSPLKVLRWENLRAIWREQFKDEEPPA